MTRHQKSGHPLLPFRTLTLSPGGVWLAGRMCSDAQSVARSSGLGRDRVDNGATVAGIQVVFVC